MLKLRGRTAKEIASRLHGEMTGPSAPKLFVLPYNRYKLDGENIWWLSVLSDNPAYAFGKFFCSDAGGHCAPGQVRCGLHLEKGIEDGAEDPSQKLLPNWEWHRFVLGMTSGKVNNAIGAAANAVGEPLQVDIVARLGDQEEEFFAETSDGTFTANRSQYRAGIMSHFLMWLVTTDNKDDGPATAISASGVPTANDVFVDTAGNVGYLSGLDAQPRQQSTVHF